ncbi:MAG TPA: hypothetical protein VMH34_08325 [Gammaproteobacteria bacterium]|nr:hypothetical protein [Gammaproteobacteria bacterium]
MRLRLLAGVSFVRWLDVRHLAIRYDLRQLDFVQIKRELATLGVSLAATFWDRLREGLWSYMETTQREVDAMPAGWDADVQRIYVSRYRRRRHGFRDERPQQWRKYLDRAPAPDKP